MKKCPYLIFILLVNCQEKSIEFDDRFESSSTLVDTTENIIFLPTLESKLELSKNSIYASTLLYAWEELKNNTDGTIENFSNPELENINKSLSYFQTLLENEYQTNVNIKNNGIEISSSFKKDLSFEYPMDLADTILFDSRKIKTFTPDFSIDYNSVKIKYYYSDEDFALQINPSDSLHEIILIKSDFEENTTFKSELFRYNLLKDYAENNLESSEKWKIEILDKDTLLIPIINFDLYSNYPNLKNSSFTIDNSPVSIEKIKQRIQFRLDQNGAIVESEFEIAVAYVNEVEEIKPKKLIFDKPFLIFLKRKDAKFPYFAAYIKDSRLLDVVK